MCPSRYSTSGIEAHHYTWVDKRMLNDSRAQSRALKAKGGVKKGGRGGRGGGRGGGGGGRGGGRGNNSKKSFK